MQLNNAIRHTFREKEQAKSYSPSIFIDHEGLNLNGPHCTASFTKGLAFKGINTVEIDACDEDGYRVLNEERSRRYS